MNKYQVIEYENDSSTYLYKIQQIFKKDFEAEVDNKKLRPLAECVDDTLYICVSDEIFVFEQSCAKLKFSSKFGETIKCVCAASTSGILVICLEDGKLHLLDIKTGDILHSISLILNDIFNSYVVECESYIDVIVLNSRGKCIRIKFSLESLIRKSHNEDVCQEEIFNLNHHISCSCLAETHLVLAYDTQLYVHNLSNNQWDSSSIDQKLLRIYYVQNDILIGLNTEGCLLYVCLDTFLTYYANTLGVIENIILLNTKPKTCLNILPKTKDCKKVLEVRDLQTHICKLSLQLDAYILLIPSNSLSDYFYFELLGNGIVLHCIREITPESYRNLCIENKNYEAAETIAKKWNLNGTCIAASKVNDLLLQKFKYSANDVNAILQLLNDLDDQDKLQKAVEIVKKEHQDVCGIRKVFDYFSAKITNLDFSDRTTKINRNEMNDMKHKFDIFTSLVLINVYTVADWNAFLSNSLLDELIVQLTSNNIASATIICSRLDYESIKCITNEFIANVLKLLNYKHLNTMFVRSVFSVILNNPKNLTIFYDWLHKVILDVENCDPTNFPQGIIVHVEMLINMCKYQINCEELECFLVNANNIRKSLMDIKDLKENWKIHLKFTECKNARVLIHNLLENVQLNDTLLMNYLQVYLLKNNMDINDIFIEEIMYMINKPELPISRIKAMLDYLNKIEDKLEIVLNILRNVYPWNNPVRSLAVEYSHYEHYLSDAISYYLQYEDILDHLQTFGEEIDFSDENDLKYAINKLLRSNRQAKDVYKLCLNEAYRSSANITIANYLIKKGDCLQLAEWIENIPPNEAEEVYEYVICMNDVLMSNFDSHIAPDACTTIATKCQDLPQHQIFLKQMRKIKNIKRIEIAFGIKVNANALDNDSLRNELFVSLINTMANDFDPNESTLTQTCELLADTFDYSEDFVILKFCQSCSKPMITRLMANYLCSKESATSEIASMIMLLLQQPFLHNNEHTLLDFSITLSGNNQPDVEDFQENLIVAQKLISKALCFCKNDELLAISELANWLQFGSCFVQKKRTSNGFQLGMDYYSKIPKPNVNSSVVYQEVFTNYFSFISQHNDPSYAFLSDNDIKARDMSQEIFKRQINELSSAIMQIAQDGQEFLAYNLLSGLQRKLKCIKDLDRNVLEHANNSLKQPIAEMITNKILVINNSDIDFIYMLLMDNTKKFSEFLFKNLKKYRNEYSKFKLVVKLCDKFAREFGVNMQHKILVLKCKWWEKVDNEQLSYTDFFFKQSLDIFQMLTKHNLIDLSHIVEFCLDFNLSTQLCYMMLLKQTISNWKPTYSIIEDFSGEKLLTVTNDRKQLFFQCMNIIKAIDNKVDVIEELNEIYKTVNYYYYEVFLCILEILNALETKPDESSKKALLAFLVNYRRISKPNTTEYDELNISSTHTPIIMQLSQFRLPYIRTLLSSNVLNFIRKEINLTTYKLWFEILPVLQEYISKDDLCIAALKAINIPRTTESNTSWNLSPKYNHLAEEIDSCVEHMSDKELAIPIIFYLMHGMSDGVDKMNMARLCYKYTFDCKENRLKSKEVEQIKTQILNVYNCYRVKHILFFYGLNQDAYLAASGNITNLINLLYSDSRITSSNYEILPDINKCVDDLADINRLDIFEFRCKLLEDFFLEATNITYNDRNEELLRAQYICKSGDTSEWRNYLLENYSDSNKDLYFRAKVMQCLCSICNESYILKHFETNFVGFKKNINKMILADKLKDFGILISDINHLDNYKKSKIFLNLNRIKTEASAILMALICITYEIYEAKYWKAIFRLGVSLKMHCDLICYIKLLQSNVDFTQEDFYTEAWQFIIENSFSSLNSKVNEVYFVLEKIHLIEACPVRTKLNFVNIMEILSYKQLYVVAALCLSYCDEISKKKYSKIILNNSNNIIRELKALNEYGLWSIDAITKTLVNYTTHV